MNSPGTPPYSSAIGPEKTSIIIFIDVVGFTTINRSLQPEIVTNLAECGRIHFEGSKTVAVIKTQPGDAIIAAFMLEETDNFNPMPDGICHVLIQLGNFFIDFKKKMSGIKFRTSIHIGRSFTFDDVNRTKNFTGDGVNKAERIIKEAVPGQILVSADTAKVLADLEVVNIEEVPYTLGEVKEITDKNHVTHEVRNLTFEHQGVTFGNPTIPFTYYRKPYFYIVVCAIVLIGIIAITISIWSYIKRPRPCNPSNCLAGRVCRDDVCVPGEPQFCQGKDSNCKDGRVCVNEVCATPPLEKVCGKDLDCPGNYICERGSCFEQTPTSPGEIIFCHYDIDCPAARVCTKGFCSSPALIVPDDFFNLPSCAPNVADAQTLPTIDGTDINCIVRDEKTGAPVERAQIFFSGASLDILSVSRVIKTDSRGLAHVNGTLPQGDYRIWIEHPDYPRMSVGTYDVFALSQGKCHCLLKKGVK